MLNKLAFRNMKRSAKDYLVYILTMTVVTALMYSFDSLFFQNEFAVFYMQGVDVMQVMLGLATVFILLITAWLINYMVRFMLEKRSSEFGLYLLLGMKKKTVSRLYIRENLLLGSGAFILGCLLGVLLQQILMSILFSMVKMEYHLHMELNPWTLLMTLLLYAICYLLALLRCRRKFRKMNIYSLMNAKRQNEEIREKHEGAKRFLLPFSMLGILMFWTVFGRLSNTGEIFLFLIGLVLTIYLFYVGLSAWLICYVRKKGRGIYRGQNLFLLRQFSSKVRTMQFTMGTLTALFTLALLGASIALMFNEYENTVLEEKYPFDIQIYSADIEEDFAREKAVIEEEVTVSQYYAYHIYTDGQNQVNTWFLTHLDGWKNRYCKEDGSPDMPEIEKMLRQDGIYYPYDTYMGITDYNHLRNMLGLDGVALTSGEYLIQIKPRLYHEIQEISQDLQIADASGQNMLKAWGIASDFFSQDGHNGADYIIVVPDEVLERMQPYYSELVAEVEGEMPVDMMSRLDALNGEGQYELQEYYDELDDQMEGDYIENPDLCSGSDNIIIYVAVNSVGANQISWLKYALGSMILPLFYIGLVFVCVAMTVLSVQQLSDSAKYKFRYDVLAKLGLERFQIRRLILKQLAAYYLCPAVLAMIISGKMILFVSERFVTLTGVPALTGSFFFRSILLFFGIYLVYFIVTYVGFKRNVEERSRIVTD